MLFLLASFAYAACTFDASLELLSTNIDAAEEAYVSLDVPEFQRAMTEVDYLLPCLTEPVSPSLAAELHRIRAIGQYVDGKQDAVAASLVAARTLEPSYAFPLEVLPEGFELRTMYEQTEPSEEPSKRMPKPSGDTTLYVDGTPSRERPERAALLQVADQGLVRGSHYLLPDDGLPDYPGVDRRRTALLTGSVVTGAASLAMYGGAWVSHESLKSAETSQQLQSGTQRTHLLAAGSGVLFAGALAQVGIAILDRRKR